MRRKPEIDECYEYLYEAYPFLWKKCSKCGYEFKREKGWRAYLPPGRKEYLCKVCAPTRSDASEYFISEIERDSKRPIDD